MTPTEEKQWLEEHIPHRIRVMLASTAELSACRTNGEPSFNDDVVERCWTDAVWEGRLSALRWLCEFVGVQMGFKSGQAERPKAWPTDTNVRHLSGGVLLPLPSPEADLLAKAWKACTQGSVHPTHNSNHPRIDDPERTKAFEIIKNHLSTTVYSAEPDWIAKWVLQPSK
ncbi:MAG: hypothetical protein AABZ53_03955 [Planctomycetota bacterium]